MPNEGDPTYAVWKVAVAQQIVGLADRAILVSHSIGGTILINSIAEAPVNQKLDGIFLVAAPFVGAGGRPGEEMSVKANLDARLPPNTPIYLYHGNKDDTAICAYRSL
jgi:predicted alpha/beta hydrolase family esterase